MQAAAPRNNKFNKFNVKCEATASTVKWLIGPLEFNEMFKVFARGSYIYRKHFVCKDRT